MTLYENFNTTNQTSPHAEKHINFVSNMQLKNGLQIDKPCNWFTVQPVLTNLLTESGNFQDYQPTCALVATLEYHDRCKYVISSQQCRDNLFIFDYSDLLYCKIDARSVFATTMGVILLILILVMLFIILGSTADGFFCPSLTAVSRIMGLNENVAGVTLLAFGNGAPDIFTSYASLNSESKSQYSNTYGATIFVVMLVAGALVVHRPFTVVPESFLRDILFLLLSITFIDYCIKLNYYITLYQSIALLVIYISYIVVVILDQYLLKRATKSLQRMSNRKPRKLSTAETINLQHLQKEGVVAIHSKSSISTQASRVHDFVNPQEEMSSGHIQQFLYTVIPFSWAEFRSSNYFQCTFLCIRFPILLFLRFLIPLVEMDELNQGWSQLLNCMQICTLPTFITFGLARGQFVFYGVPLYVIFALVTAIIAAIVFCLTQRLKPPIFHRYYSILGVLGSIFIVYSTAQEITSILDVIGITTQRSNSFIGCTLLAMGNSVGDFVSDLSLARSGYQKMAFAACFGGPLFNSLMSLSPALIYRTAAAETGYITFPEGTMGENATIFLYFGLIGTVIAAATTNFVFRRSIGIYMITVYLLYLFFTILGEMEVIHTFGSDHSLDLKIDVSL